MIFKLAHPTEDELTLKSCDCIGTYCEAYEADDCARLLKSKVLPPIIPTYLLLVNKEFYAEVKPILDHRRTLISCSRECSDTALKKMTLTEKSMIKMVRYIFQCSDPDSWFPPKKRKASVESHVFSLQYDHFEESELTRHKYRENKEGFVEVTEIKVSRAKVSIEE